MRGSTQSSTSFPRFVLFLGGSAALHSAGYAVRVSETWRANQTPLAAAVSEVANC